MDQEAERFLKEFRTYLEWIKNGSDPTTAEPIRRNMLVAFRSYLESAGGPNVNPESVEYFVILGKMTEFAQSGGRGS